MIRKELVAKLEQVAPALSTNDLVPILTHFCFNGDEVFAYNEQIGIAVPCKTEFKGAVPGNTLLNLLQASRANKLKFENKGGELVVFASSSKLRLPLLPSDRFVWQPPAIKKGGDSVGVDTKQFRAAVTCCLRSVSIDTSIPDQLGVTLIAGGKELAMYATDSVTFSHAVVALKKNVGDWKRVILSGTFCQQLLSIADKERPLHLEVHKDHALLAGAHGVILFGSLIHSPKPLNLAGIISDNYTDKQRKLSIAIPGNLEGVLDRACIVSATNGEPVKMEVDIVKGQAKFFTQAKITECRDTIELNHPDVSLAVNPKLVRNGCGVGFDKMLVTKNAFIMSTDNAVYMVAAN